MALERSMSGSLGIVTVRDESPGGGSRGTAARLRMAALVFSADRREMWLGSRDRLVRATGLASVLFCVLFAAVFVIKPLRNLEVVKVVLPPTRTIDLKDIVPEPPAPAEALEPEREQVSVRKVADAPVVKAPEPELLPPTPKIQPPKPVDRIAAQAGRERARAATAELAKATASLDRALGDLTSSLGAAPSGDYRASRSARTRNVGSGRTDGQLGAVGNGVAGSGASVDVGGSAVKGTMVAIGSLAAAAPAQERAGAEGGIGAGSRPGVYRTNASLLAVIQKYAAGIQYCYESELKRDESLRGKLIVAMTITAGGAVQEATVVRNTVGSERLAACALSQIRSWRFPPIDGGLTTFQAPFVFTPPK
jgi:TonB family protein